MARMTKAERREQLIEVAKEAFAEHGFDAATIEEIAARAAVSKPVVYEHFGGKDALFNAVVDIESQRLLTLITTTINPDAGARAMVHASAIAFLTYISEDPAGFRVLTRDAPAAAGIPDKHGITGLLHNVAAEAAGVLASYFQRGGLDPAYATMYAKGLVGMVSHIGSWWANNQEHDAQDIAAHITSLAYFGLRDLPPNPHEALGLGD